MADSINVRLVNPVNNAVVLQEQRFNLVKGCLPMNEIKTKFQLKKPYWVDGEMEIGVTKDGLSDFSVTHFKVVRISESP